MKSNRGMVIVFSVLGIIAFGLCAYLALDSWPADKAEVWQTTFLLRRRESDIVSALELFKEALVTELQEKADLPPGFPQVEALVIDPHPTIAGSALERRKAYRILLDEEGQSLLLFYRLDKECEARYWPYTLYILSPWPWDQVEVGCTKRVVVEAPLEWDDIFQKVFAALGAKPYPP